MNINIRKKKVLVFIIVLAMALLSFAGLLHGMSYRKMRASTYVHASRLNIVGTVREINYALSFGKPIQKYFGLSELLEEVVELSEDIQGIQVQDELGQVLKSVGDFPETVYQSAPGEEYVMTRTGIYSFNRFDAGQLVLRLDAKPVQDAFHQYVRTITFMSLGLWVLIIILLPLAFLGKRGGQISMRRIRTTSLVLQIGAQLVLGVFSTAVVDMEYRESVETIAQVAANTIQSDFNAVIRKGVSFEELEGLDEYFEHLVSDMDEVSEIHLVDEEAGQEEDKDENTRAFVLDIEGVDSKVLTVRSQFDIQEINRRRINNAIDVIILILITVFISLELLNSMNRHLEEGASRKKGELYLPAFRLFIFVDGLAFALDAGFFAILSTKLASAMDLPESLSFLGGMPNTMYSLAVLIGLFASSSLISRFGMRKVLSAGIWAGIVGYILCALSRTLPILIVARFIFGFCDGLIVNSIRLFAASQKDPQMHNRLLVDYLAAINLGLSCGVVIGGLVADVTNYASVFFFGALLGSICLFLIRFAGFGDGGEDSQKHSFLGAVRCLRNPQVLLYMLCCVIPIYFAGLFVAFTFPLFGDEIGFSNAMVSACLMINYLIVAYLTDPISEWVTKRISMQTALRTYMVMQAISIGIFVVANSAWAAILALVLTSFWDGFGMVAMDSGLEGVEGTSTEEGTLLQMVFGKFALVLGPVTLTSLLSLGAARATGIIPVLLLAGVAIYVGFEMSQAGKKKVKSTEGEGR